MSDDVKGFDWEKEVKLAQARMVKMNASHMTPQQVIEAMSDEELNGIVTRTDEKLADRKSVV